MRLQHRRFPRRGHSRRVEHRPILQPHRLVTGTVPRSAATSNARGYAEPGSIHRHSQQEDLFASRDNAMFLESSARRCSPGSRGRVSARLARIALIGT